MPSAARTVLAVAAAAGALRASATLLAVSQLEACADGGASPMSCAERFAVLLSVQNGQNGTESVVAQYGLRTATDAGGATYALEDSLDISLAKSRIRLIYPLTYTRQYNNQPHEIFLTRDGSGRAYNSLLNKCDAGAACGSVSAAAGQPAIASGFCCSCAACAAGGACTLRGGLQCGSLFDVSNQAAYCLRMDPLWYSAFAIGAPDVDFSIDVVIKRCLAPAGSAGVGAGAPANGTASPSATPPPASARTCALDIVTLSPAAPSACVTLTAPSAASPAPAGAPSLCDVQATLVGDFAAYAGAPDLSGKLLLAPLVCDSAAACGNRTTEDAGRWLVVDVADTTTGAGCDEVGVSYSGFAGQGGACTQPLGSCLHYQPQDRYAADAAAAAAGRPTSAFLSGFAPADGGVSPLLGDARNLRLQFMTARFQASVVSLYVDAAAVRYVVRVASAAITCVDAPPFAALSGGGRLTVSVASTGNEAAEFTVGAACGLGGAAGGGVLPIGAQPLSLGVPPDPSAAANVTFSLAPTSAAGGAYVCVITVTDALGRVAATATADFNATAVVANGGEQGGSLAPGAPATGEGAAAAVTGGCAVLCPSQWDVLCAVAHRCTPAFVTWVGGAVAGLALLVLLAKFPWLVTAPAHATAALAAAAARALCSGCGCGGRRAADGPAAPHRDNGDGERGGVGAAAVRRSRGSGAHASGAAHGRRGDRGAVESRGDDGDDVRRPSASRGDSRPRAARGARARLAVDTADATAAAPASPSAPPADDAVALLLRTVAVLAAQISEGKAAGGGAVLSSTGARPAAVAAAGATSTSASAEEDGLWVHATDNPLMRTRS